MSGAETHAVRRRPRDTARQLVQRLQAIPVALRPSKLNTYFTSHTTQSSTAHGTSLTSPLTSSSSTTMSHPTPPSLSQGVDGLAAQDVLLVGCDAATAYHTSAMSDWCYGVAALHALRGGRVVHVSGPATSGLDTRCLVHHLEQLLRSAEYATRQHDKRDAASATTTTKTTHTSATSEEGVVNDVVDALAEQRQRVLDALGRVDEVCCRDITDLYVFCAYYTFPDNNNNSGSTPGSPTEVAHDTVTMTPLHANAVNEEETETAVPLVLVHGVAGKDGYVYHYERARGVEVPVEHWLLRLLQQRVRCALILTEYLGVLRCITATSNARGGALYRKRPRFGDATSESGTGAAYNSGALSCAEEVVRESDYVQRFRRMTAAAATSSGTSASRPQSPATTTTTTAVRFGSAEANTQWDITRSGCQVHYLLLTVRGRLMTPLVTSPRTVVEGGWRRSAASCTDDDVAGSGVQDACRLYGVTLDTSLQLLRLTFDTAGDNTWWGGRRQTSAAAGQAKPGEAWAGRASGRSGGRCRAQYLCATIA